METSSQLLGGLGSLGIVMGVLLGAVLLFVLPWCAIVECVRSDRSGNAKAFLVVALVLTWGLGCIPYGLFITRSKPLRIFTLVATLVPLVILVPSIISLGTGAKMGDTARVEREQAEVAEATAAFQPGVLPAAALEPFAAVHFIHGRSGPRMASLALFAPAVPRPETARDIDVRVRHVAHDVQNDRYFALTTHDFGTITPSSGRFTKVEVDPSLGDFSWPKGLALDTTDGRVVIMTSHVYTRFYKYDPRTSDWERLPTEIRDLSLVSLTYSPESGSLHALERTHGQPTLQTIHRFNTDGASLGGIELNPAIPVSRRQSEFYQLHASADKLVVLLPPFDPGEAPGSNRIFFVDPNTGAVSVARDADSEAVISRRM